MGENLHIRIYYENLNAISLVSTPNVWTNRINTLLVLNKKLKKPIFFKNLSLDFLNNKKISPKIFCVVIIILVNSHHPKMQENAEEEKKNN